MVSVWHRAALIAGLVASASCQSDPTGLMVVVDIDPMLRPMMEGHATVLDVAVTYRGKSGPEIRHPVVSNWPATIALHSDQWRGEVLIEVSLTVGAPMGADAGMMRQEYLVGRAIAAYSEGKVLAVPIVLWGICNTAMVAQADMMRACQFPRLITQPVLSQAAINTAGALRQLDRDPVLAQTCGFDMQCTSAIVATPEYQPAMALPCESGRVRRITCEQFTPPPDDGSVRADASTDVPSQVDRPVATDTPSSADVGVDASPADVRVDASPTDTSAPDAGPTDASATDASATDAGPTDASAPTDTPTSDHGLIDLDMVPVDVTVPVDVAVPLG